MKRILLIWTLLLSGILCLGEQSKAYWQSVPQGSVGAAAAMAFDAVSHGELSNANSPLSWTHTPVGTPSAVVVGIGNYEGASSVTSVTYGATTLTQLAILTGAGNGVYLYGANNVASGAQTVTVTLSANGNFTQANAITVTGSSLTTAFETATTATDFSTTPSVTTTSQSDEIVVDMVISSGSVTITPGAGQTQRYSVTSNASSTKVASGVSTTMNETLSFAGLWLQAAVAFHN
jgi:hypothetical protein